MSLTTLSDLRSSLRETVTVTFANSIFTGAGIWIPGTGTYPSAGDTTSGVVPTDSTFGPTINFGSGDGYITRITGQSGAAGRILLFDRLYAVGAFTTNGPFTLSGQPSFSSRLPGGSYAGTYLWAELSTISGGSTTVTCTYTNEAGTTGQSTTSATITMNAATSQYIPFVAGDRGIQTLESVSFSNLTGTSCAMNLIILRPLAFIRVEANEPFDLRFDKAKMPLIYNNSALGTYFRRDASSTHNFLVEVEIASK